MTTTTTSHKRKRNVVDLNTIKRFKDLHFNILDDHHDPQEHFDPDLNRYFTSPTILPVTYDTQEAIVMDIHLDYDDDDVDNEEMDVVTQKDEEQELSQRMTALSMEQKNKKMKVMDSFDFNDIDYDRIVDMEEEIEDQVPIYLSDDNDQFKQRMKKILRDQSLLSSISMEELRQITILKHHTRKLEQKKRLLLVYLRSVRGTLKEPWTDSLAIDRHYVPPAIRSKDKGNTDYHSYENLLQQQIEQIDNTLAEYHRQQYAPLPKSMDEFLNEIIEYESMSLIRMKYDALIALVEYDYDATMLKRKYLIQKPTSSQWATAQRLYTLRFDSEKARRILLEWKQSILVQRVPKELYSSMLSMIMTIDENTGQSSIWTNRYEQLVRQHMTDFMLERIQEAEQYSYQCRQRDDSEIQKVWKEYHDPQSDQSMPKKFIDIIEQRLINIRDRSRIIYNYRMNDPMKISSRLFGYGPCLTIHSNPFSLTRKQMELLNRGPTYVVPCQWLSVSSTPSSKNDMLKEFYMPLKQQMTRLFAKHHVNIALSMDIHQKLRQQFDEQFLQTIPLDLQQRSVDEKKLLCSIRRYLDQKRTLRFLRRTADNQNTFYLGVDKEFEEKSNELLNQCDAYEYQLTIDDKQGGNEWQTEVHRMIDSMNSMLRQIHEKKGINHVQLKQLLVDTATIKLPYMYFLPKIDQSQILSVVPMIAAYESPTWLLGRFLDRLLRPKTRVAMQRTGIDNETDFALKLHHFYQQERIWTSKTLLATIHIKNYYTIASHSSMAEILGYFLEDNLARNVIENLTIVHLKNLVQIFLYNNIFVYDNKIYKFIKGSPTTMPLTETLANIYLCEWQKMLLKQINVRQQFFARHQQDIFFTWNGTEHELQQLMQLIQTRDTNIQFDLSIGSAVHYMNAYVENQSGQLFCRVDHSHDHQQYTLPYFNHHSIEDHSDWLRYALLRAVCYSTSIMDFTRERLYLEMTYLTNGYSLLYVEQRVDHFFNYFSTVNMRYNVNQKVYERFRLQILTYIEKRKELLEKIHQYDDDRKLFHFHYLYEYGPRFKFNETFHRHWDQHFKKHPILSTDKSKIMLTTKHQYSLNAYLGQPPALRFRTLPMKKS